VYKHILIPTDGSAVAEKGVVAGVEFARKAGAKVTLFTAVPEYEIPGEGEMLSRTQLISPYEHERNSEALANRNLAHAVHEARAAGLEFDTGYAQANHPWRAIVKAAKERGCDAIFMGSHGRKGLARLFNGSQAIDVLTHSDIPTLVVR
jgi:nucleotide-binding universal stress UspA family protein